MPVSEIDNELRLLIGILAVIVLFILIVGLASFSNGFSQELKYLNNEIKRTTGSERRYYIRKKRRLWLSLIPFVKR